MTGKEERLLLILKKANKLIIPVYQRNYDWLEKHCRTLFDDLVKTAQNDKRITHFFGGIVSVLVQDARAEFLIIDGQQRITTVSLLLLALAKLLKEGKMHSSEEFLADEIIIEYLANEINPNNRKIKLKPIKGDAAAFDLLWGNSKEFNRSSKITQNYQYFYDRIQKGELTADQIFDAVYRLQVIDIILTPPADDPQLVFESLNSTGLALSEGDKIRNYILMGLTDTKAQERFYDEYWHPIEKTVGWNNDSNSFDVSGFIRDFLSLKQRKIPSINTVYISFKEYAEPLLNFNRETLLKDMLEYARLYAKLLNGSPDFTKQLNASINRLNRLGSSVTRPFLMEVLRLRAESILSDADTAEVFRVAESYLSRRIICDLPSNALSKVFLALANDVSRLGGTDNFVNKMKYILTSKEGKARFPKDDEFDAGLLCKNVYQMPKQYKAYLFERFENGDSFEYRSIYDRLDGGDYTIEHIMPQKLTAEWEEALGPDFKSIHETWLHRLANLTLCAREYNTQYNNSTFEKKRTVKDGYLESGLRMNQFIARNTKWGAAELEARAEDLKKQAYGLWPFAGTEYAPPEKQFNEYSLDDDEDTFTNIDIIRYRFNGVEQKVKSWVEMFGAVLRTLHEKDKSILNRLADADQSDGLSRYVDRTESFSRKSTEKWASALSKPIPFGIDDELYVWTNTSTRQKIILLRKFFDLYGEEPENLVFITK